MSIAEELHKTIDELSEEQQQELLETARQFLGEQPTTAGTSEPEADSELNEELLRRYHHLRQHPEQVVSARESNQRVRDQYGW